MPVRLWQGPGFYPEKFVWGGGGGAHAQSMNIFFFVNGAQMVHSKSPISCSNRYFME